MSEENVSGEEQWEAPPPPEKIAAEPEEASEMSELGTVGNIFIEPGRTFEDLRRKPRFMIAFLIIAVLATGYAIGLQRKVGDENLKRAMIQQSERSGQFATLSEKQKQDAADMGVRFQKIGVYFTPVFLAIAFLIGGLIYWGGIKAFGGSARFTHGLAAFVYSSLPPVVVSQVANGIMLLLKPADEINFLTSQRGMIRANPTLVFDKPDMPVLMTLLSTFDVFVIWGIVLAAIGLHKLGKIPKGSAWTIVIILALISLTARVLISFFQGVPV